jgi:hypothetical protein
VGDCALYSGEEGKWASQQAHLHYDEEEEGVDDDLLHLQAWATTQTHPARSYDD